MDGTYSPSFPGAMLGVRGGELPFDPTAEKRAGEMVELETTLAWTELVL